jgi:hypothetical protein
MGGSYGMYAGQDRWKQDFGGGPNGKRQLGKPRRTYEDNIKTDV